MTDDELIDRAIRLYCEANDKAGYIPTQPGRSSSVVYTTGVQLNNCNGRLGFIRHPKGVRTPA